MFRRRLKSNGRDWKVEEEIGKYKLRFGGDWKVKEEIENVGGDRKV